MRKLLITITTVALVAGASWYFSYNDQIVNFVQQYVENGEFLTLKVRHTADQIMEAHKKELIVDSQHSYLEPTLKFHPYLLMDVKYSQPGKKSREGTILWSLVDGEMFINSETWEKTHGFEDAINAGATRNDFKIMYALAKNKGSASVDQMEKELRVDKEILHGMIESALTKHLVTLRGNEVQLHFQDPKILVQPETKLTDWLVKKPYSHEQKVIGHYSSSQIQKIAKAAFGDDFTVRNTTEVYLPVYSIEVLNPDGSTFTTYWNALTGDRMTSRPY